MLYVQYGIPARNLIASSATESDLVPTQNSGVRALAEWDAVPDAPWVWSTADLNFITPTSQSFTRVSRQVFMDRIGEDEVAAIILASRADTVIGSKLAGWLLRYQVVPDIDLTDPRTIAGVDALIALGLVNANKRDAILALPS